MILFITLTNPIIKVKKVELNSFTTLLQRVRTKILSQLNQKETIFMIFYSKNSNNWMKNYNKEKYSAKLLYNLKIKNQQKQIYKLLQ